MKFSLSMPLVATVLISQQCCSALQDEELPKLQMRRRREEARQPGFGSNTVRQPSMETENQDDWGHVPFQSRIVGGSNAGASEYPFHVSLGGCGASLIYEDIILTAAHCQPLYPSYARVGGDTRNNGELAQIEGSGTWHPQYSSLSQDFDFMVYKLASPVTSVSPVQLNNDFNNPSDGQTLIVMGFGSTYEGGPGSFNLQKVEVNKVSHTNCNFAYRGQIEEDVMFCAGVDGGGADSCQGDSGGPIVDQNGVQVGVTSWGNGCAERGYPGVYARVSGVYDWIQQQICELSDNPPSTCGNTANSDGNVGGDENDNSQNDNNQDDNSQIVDDNSTIDNPGSDLVQPKGISLRIDINYDEYPQENAWTLYNDDTKQELHWTNYGDVTSPGLQSMTFTDLVPGKYVFLLLDKFWDGICCQYGNGYINIYEVFPPESGLPEELRWNNDGNFLNAAGATFVITEEGRRALQSLKLEFHDKADDLENSPYLH